MKQKNVNWKVLVASLMIVYLVAFVGSLFTSGNTDSDWYESVRPAITPASWVFPIVWNVLFFLIGLSLYFAWTGAKKFSRAKQISAKKKIALVFGINFFLNILWSVFYFGMQKPSYALVEIFFLEASIVWMIYVSCRADKKAGWLLVPYLLWVGFAIVLNWLSV